MESYSYKTILARARTMKKSVENEQKVGVNVKWSYYLELLLRTIYFKSKKGY